MKKTLMIAASVAALVLTSCNEKDEVDPSFLNTAEISLTVKGSSKFKYEAGTCQLGYNPVKNEYRVCNDDMSDYYIVDLQSVPTAANQKIKGSITWTESDNLITKSGLEFIVASISGDGMVWLWNGKEKIGAIVSTLE